MAQPEDRVKPTNQDCATCTQPIEGDGFDPGHNYGCARRLGLACHERSCSSACYLSAAEDQDQRRITHAHGA